MKKQILEKQLEFPFRVEEKREESIERGLGWTYAGIGVGMTVGIYLLSIQPEQIKMIGRNLQYIMNLF